MTARDATLAPEGAPAPSGSATPAVAKTESFDDVMLAMDIVDSLRHRERVVGEALSSEAREQKLISRLQEIYAAQGIDVPDAILKDGVKALEEKRFDYEPKAGGVSLRLARLYVSRGRWLPTTLILLTLAIILTVFIASGLGAVTSLVS